jgi:membrane-bound lytic murein transglycosylase B
MINVNGSYFKIGAAALLCMAALLVPGLALASAEQSYKGHEAVNVLIDELVAEEGFSRAELEGVFAGAVRKQSILDAISRPAEKRLAWHQYRKIFVTSKRAAQGVEFYEKHRATLDRAASVTGVPAEIIVAILGVETRYGRLTGSYRVIDALSTLAFDYPKRSRFFRGELKHFMILTREQKLDPSALKGSYAGAMGYGQFISRSYRAYAVDFDDDGLIDIWNNPVDAIGSVANYFKAHGWRPGEPVTSRAEVKANYRADRFDGKLKPKLAVGDLRASNIYPLEAYPAEAKATAMRFEGEKGEEFWVGLHNFYVITRYNHSSMYAMAVYQLSQEIKDQGKL